MPDVAFADVEALCVAFANAQTESPTSTKEPQEPTDRWTLLQRTGGYALNRVLEQVQITATCTGPDPDTAAADATALRNAFHNKHRLMPLVRRVEETVGPYYDPDPDTNADRYSFTLQLTVRAKR